MISGESIIAGASATVASAGWAMVGTGASVGATVAFGRAVLRRGCWLKLPSDFGVDLASFVLLAIFFATIPLPPVGFLSILTDNVVNPFEKILYV